MLYQRRVPLVRFISRPLHGIATGSGSQSARTWISHEMRVGLGGDSRKILKFLIESMHFMKAHLQVEPCRWRTAIPALGGKACWFGPGSPGPQGRATESRAGVRRKSSRNANKPKDLSMRAAHTKRACFIRASVIPQCHWCAKTTECHP